MTAARAQVHRDIGYLETRMRWAANNHPGFDEFAADLRQLHGRLERATGRVRKPATAGASCFDCGGDLIRPLTDEGLEVEDVVTCQQCHATYDGPRYALALSAAVQAASVQTFDGEEYGTVEAVARTVGRSENTIRKWAGEGALRRVTQNGVPLLSLDDARQCDETRGRRRVS